MSVFRNSEPALLWAVLGPFSWFGEGISDVALAVLCFKWTVYSKGTEVHDFLNQPSEINLNHHQFSLHRFSVAPSNQQQVYKIFKIVLSKYIIKLFIFNSFCVHVGRILSYVLPTVGNGEMRLKLLFSLKSLRNIIRGTSHWEANPGSPHTSGAFLCLHFHHRGKLVWTMKWCKTADRYICMPV